MTFEEAVEVARHIMAAGYYVASVTCDLPGAVPGVWRVLFRLRPGDVETKVAASPEHWAYWQLQDLQRRRGEGGEES